jgi:hypothetical protein
MSVANANRRYEDLRETLGKAGTNALFPREFEYYLISLELVNSRGFTEDFFTFPVTPNSIKEMTPYLTNIRKTNTGVTVTKTDSFVPRDISISGNFGRQFKTIVNRNLVSFTGIALTAVTGGLQGLVSNFKSQSGAEIVSSVFNREIKTGFGCLKVLETILRRSQERDPYGLPYRLLFYNPALGNNYIVEPINFSQNQQMENNAIWNYNLDLKAVAPLEQIADLNEFNLIRSLSKDNILRNGGKLANRLVSRIGRLNE